VDPLQWAVRERAVDFFDVKGDLESLLAPRSAVFEPGAHPALHPGRTARVCIDGRAVGHVGELHPRWRLAYELPQTAMLFELDLAEVLQDVLPAFVSLPRQQSAWRDVALVLPHGAAHQSVAACLCADDHGLVRGATLFDVYRPGGDAPGMASGEHSMAYRLELRDDAATLTDDRIDTAVAAAVARVQAAFGGRLRA